MKGPGGKCELKNAMLSRFFTLHRPKVVTITHCLATKDSWRQNQRDIINIADLYHEDGIKHVKPEYDKLTNETESAWQNPKC